MALLRTCGAAAALLLASSCGGSTQVGDLRARVGDPEQASDAQRVQGWLAASEESSRFAGGLLLLAEWDRTERLHGVLELDLPADERARPVLRYSEWRGDERTFEGDAARGRLEVSRDLWGTRCGCSGGAFALVFVDTGPDGVPDNADDQQRVVDAATFGLEAGGCDRHVSLGDEVQLLWRRVDDCARRAGPASRTAAAPSPSPPSTTVVVVEPAPTYYDPYDDRGCSGPPPSGYDDSAGGCEGDASDGSSSAGCEADDTASEDGAGCEGDDTGDSSSGCEGDTLARRRRPARTRPLAPRHENALTFLGVLAIPRLRRRSPGR